jgi:GNAT superfamily N-acetyltransferase
MSTALPVQRLAGSARDAYLAHLLALGPDDVRLRFGTALAGAAVTAYVDGIDFGTDAIFGVYDDRLALAGAAHLAFSRELAELGVSVVPGARRRGIGGALVARAAEHACNRAVPRLFMHCLADHATMVRIARRAGMDVVIESGDADALLVLPPATPLSLASELLADRVALYDHAMRTGVETWRRIGVALAEPTRA